MGSLAVNKIVKGKTSTKLFMKSGNQGNKWINEKIPFMVAEDTKVSCCA